MGDDRITRVACIPLVVPIDCISYLHSTRVAYAYCQRRAREYCWGNPLKPGDLCTSTRDAEKALYHCLRKETDELHANLVQKAIKDVTANVTTAKSNWKSGDRVNQPSYPTRREDGQYAMTYDKRAATFSKYSVSLATCYGRVECRYVLPAELDGTPYERYVLNPAWSFGTSKLVFDGERFWIHAVCTRSKPTDPVWRGDDEDGSDTRSRARVLGVDLNVDGHSAVTSTAGFHGNADELNDQRDRFEQVRDGLQETATRSAHETLQGLKGREWGHYRNYARETARGIVKDAVEARCTHVAFEDLTRIHKRISNAPKFQQWLFRKIRESAEDALELLGIKTETVAPRYTSRRCSRTECNSCSRVNRSDKEFEVLSVDWR